MMLNDKQNNLVHYNQYHELLKITENN